MLFLIQIRIPRLDMPRPPQLGLPGRKGRRWRRWRKWRAESTVSVSPNLGSANPEPLLLLKICDE